MTTSSQHPSAALPPEPASVPRPTAGPATPADAFAAVLPVPVGSAAAQAEEEAGLFDPERAKAVAASAYQLGVDDAGAELTQLRLDSEALDWFHDRWRAAGRLCDGLDLDDMLRTGDVLTALDGRAPTVLPLTIRWDGTVAGPAGDGPGETTLVGGTTARGSNAVLVLDGAQRLTLGGLLLATLHTVEACPTPECGMAEEDLDPSDPAVSGSVLVQVAGTGGPARWWCSVWCATSAITAAGAELAAAVRAAAGDPDAQAPYEVRIDGSEPHRFEPERLDESDATRRAARCRHCQGARTNVLHTWVDDQADVDGGL